MRSFLAIKVGGQKVLIIEQKAKGNKTTKSICGRSNRCVMTEIGDSNKILIWESPSKSKLRCGRCALKSFALHKMNQF